MLSNFYHRNSAWIGHLTFGLLAVLAVWLFKERTVILDAAFQSFEIIKKESFAIQANRFGAAMTQIFPLIAVKLHLPLRGLLILYSLSFVLVHWIMFLICDRWLKAKEMAFAILLFNVFLVNHTFYWVQNEVIQGISFTLVFWAVLLKQKTLETLKARQYLVGILMLVTIAFFHPLTSIPFLFVSGYFLLEGFQKKPGYDFRLILLATGAFAGIFLLKSFFFSQRYDKETMGRLSMKNISLFFQEFQNTAGFQKFVQHLPPDFYLLPVAMAVVSIFYLKRKKLAMLLYTWVCVTGYILVVMISYIEGGYWFHVESQYLPVAIFVIVPLVWEIIPAWSGTSAGKKIITTAIVAVILIRLADVVQTSAFYTGRLNFIGSMLQKTWKIPRQKFVMEEKDADRDWLLQTWSFGYETLYYSALQSPDSTRSIFFVPDIQQEMWRFTNPKVFYGTWDIVKYEDLPPRLFHFTDTTHVYRLLTKEDLE